MEGRVSFERGGDRTRSECGSGSRGLGVSEQDYRRQVQGGNLERRTNRATVRKEKSQMCRVTTAHAVRGTVFRWKNGEAGESPITERLHIVFELFCR